MLLLLLGLIGGYAGMAVNRWVQYLNWSHHPPKKAEAAGADDGNRRRWTCCIPVVGWLLAGNRNGGSAREGRFLWIRPACIELAWIVGLPCFYIWQARFGLTGGVAVGAEQVLIWFVGQSVFIWLLFVATLIDFDQRIIPDSITVPGTLIALAIAACFPAFRLPQVVSNLAGKAVVPVHFVDAAPLPAWHTTPIGLVIATLVFSVWILALLPKFPLGDLSIRSLRIVWASAVRFLQHNNLKLRRKSRRTGLCYLLIGGLGMAAIVMGWKWLPSENWNSLFGAIVGMGFGGLMVWLIRIVASHSLGQEAMGFGDVTLMAMIGAFVGWQAGLIVFALSPFAALAVVFASYLITRENELAFGPYLCLAALITLMGWSTIWTRAKEQFFAVPTVLLPVLIAALVMLMFLMLAIRKLKERFSV